MTPSNTSPARQSCSRSYTVYFGGRDVIEAKKDDGYIGLASIMTLFGLKTFKALGLYDEKTYQFDVMGMNFSEK